MITDMYSNEINNNTDMFSYNNLINNMNNEYNNPYNQLNNKYIINSFINNPTNDIFYFRQNKIYEKYVYEYLKIMYEDVWLWKNIPSQEMGNFKFNINNDFDISIIIKNNDKYTFVKCINSNEITIDINKLSKFFQFIASYGINGIVYYNGILSSNIITNGLIKYNELPFTKHKNHNIVLGECNLCLKTQPLITFYNCQHNMCKDCYIGWRSNTSYNRCPMCRECLPQINY